MAEVGHKSRKNNEFHKKLVTIFNIKHLLGATLHPNTYKIEGRPWPLFVVSKLDLPLHFWSSFRNFKDDDAK